jgi:hypothetical protein
VGRYKLIDGAQPELFDLRVDPFEATNVFAARRALGQVLAARAASIAQAGVPATRSGEHVVPLDVRERTAALGYAAGPRHGPVAGRAPLPDPRACLLAADLCVPRIRR